MRENRKGDIMMEILKKRDGNKLDVALRGRLDTTTAPQMEAEMKTALEGVTELNFDFEKLEYVSSAGLRVLLSCQKTMKKQGKMKLRHVCEEIMEVFEITGFTDILTIE